MKFFLNINKTVFLIAVCIILEFSVCEAQNENYTLYIGEYPRGKVQWAQDAQGVTHDSANWYITQTMTLWKIPLKVDLKRVSRNSKSVRFVEMKNIPALWKEGKGYHHFGDLTYFNIERHGYLFVPIEGGNSENPNSSSPAIAVFDAETLAYIDHAVVGLPSAPWCEIDPKGLLYISNTGYMCTVKTIDWNALSHSNKLNFSDSEEFTFLDEQGNPLYINVPQGGAFSQSGNLLYLSAGYYKDNDISIGINVFDIKTHKRINKSLNGKGPFNYEIHPGGLSSQEPEGITIWETNHASAEIPGQLHAIMIGNRLLNDDMYFKHYSLVDAYPVLFKKYDYGGKPLPIPDNIPCLSKMRFNNKASSIWIPSGWTVVLYEHDNFKGDSISISNSDRSLKLAKWNNRVSSLKVYPPNTKE